MEEHSRAVAASGEQEAGKGAGDKERCMRQAFTGKAGRPRVDSLLAEAPSPSQCGIATVPRRATATVRPPHSGTPGTQAAAATVGTGETAGTRDRRPSRIGMRPGKSRLGRQLAEGAFQPALAAGQVQCHLVNPVGDGAAVQRADRAARYLGARPAPFGPFSYGEGDRRAHSGSIAVNRATLTWLTGCACAPEIKRA